MTSSSHPPARLQRTIGFFGGLSLALGMVIGAGMLSLPGLVYERTHNLSIWVWLGNGMLVLPLLVVFVKLGRKFPSAGGVSGFVGAAFPRMKAPCAYLLVGTFSLGIPGIAVTGAGYISEALGISSDPDIHWINAGIAGGMLGIVLAVAMLGGRVAGSIQNAVVALLVGGLVLVALAAIPHWGGVEWTPGDRNSDDVWQGMALAFFAYAGWEMLAFTAEEFKNPKRDFPLAVGIGFVLVMTLYVSVAITVQAIVPLNHPALTTAPLSVVAAKVFGSALPVTWLAILVIMVNLNGAVWAASRLLFDMGRDGWSPSVLSLDSLSGAGATPRNAIVAIGVLFAIALGLYGAGALDLEDLLRLAGQNFLLLYLFTTLAYIRLAEGWEARIFGSLAFVISAYFAHSFGWGLLYALALLALPLLAGGTKIANRFPVSAYSNSQSANSTSINVIGDAMP